MTEIETQLLAEFDYGIISKEVFLKNFPVDIQNNPNYIKEEVSAAIRNGDNDTLQMTINLIWLSGDTSEFVDLLNELLINPNHQSHQQIAKTLQDIRSPTTIPFVKKALDTNFDYLEYTCSDSEIIAKWFSWLLFSIGTKDAIDLIKEYSNSNNEGIRKEMLYRLKKLKS